jgi:hypothetical protein
MLHHHNGARRLAATGIRIGCMLVYASVGVASAISGVAVALQLAPIPPAGDYLPPHGGPASAIAVADTDKPARVAAATTTAALTPAIVSPFPTGNLASAAPDRAAAPPDERELTFAWGYAQRHPGATARRAEPHGDAALAGAPVATREPHHAAERPHAPRKTTGFAPSRMAVQLEDPHQALGYADPQFANGFHIFGRTQSPPAPHHRTPSPPPRA